MLPLPATPPRATGIVSASNDELVLKPLMVAVPRTFAIRFLVGGLFLSLVLIAIAAYLLRAVVWWPAALALWLVVASAQYLALIREVAIVIRRGEGVFVHQRHRFTATRSKRLAIRAQQVQGVLLGIRVNRYAGTLASPRGNPIHYAIWLRTWRKRLLWYTVYPDSAVFIAARVAALLRVPLENRSGISEENGVA